MRKRHRGTPRIDADGRRPAVIEDQQATQAVAAELRQRVKRASEFEESVGKR